MTDFIPQTISALIQILIFLLIPFIWWLVTARRTEPFFRWLGWKRPRVTHPGRLALVIIGTLVVAGAVGVLFISAAADVSPSPLTGLGFADLGAAIVYAVAQTAFAEESLFRGFLLKRIAARFGFWTGNVVQAVLFGLVHMVPFLLLGMSPPPQPGHRRLLRRARPRHGLDQRAEGRRLDRAELDPPRRGQPHLRRRHPVRPRLRAAGRRAPDFRQRHRLPALPAEVRSHSGSHGPGPA